MNVSRLFGIVLSIILAGLIANCTSGSGHGSPAYTTPLDAQTGRFLDGAVTGVEYSTGHWSHITGFDGIVPTDVPGSFIYQPGEEVTFSIGGVVLGSGRAKRNVTPIDLVPGAVDTYDNTVINICQFLQSLDDDLIPENGIFISEGVRNVLTGFESLDFTSAPRLEEVPGVHEMFDALNANNVFPENADGEERGLVSADDALIHFEDTLVVIEEEEARFVPFSAGIGKPVRDVISFQGQSFPVSGWASGGDGPYSFAWTLTDEGNNTLYRGSTPPADSTFSGLASGKYVLQFEATDDVFGETVRGQRIINVYDSSLNTFPYYKMPLSIVRNCSGSSTVSPEESITLSARILDQQGNPPFFYIWSCSPSATCIDKYYSADDNVFNAVFAFSNPGEYQVRIIVRDTMVFGDTSYDENSCNFNVTVLGNQ